MDHAPQPRGYDDAALIAGAKAGDRAAFVALAKRHQRSVYNVVFALVRDREPARAITVETLVRAWRSIRSVPETPSFHVWITRIARNLALGHQRKGGGAKPAPPFRDHAPAGAHPAALERCEAAWAALTPEHQSALSLRLVERMSYAEIADALDVTQAVAVARVSGARAALLSRLGGPEPLE